MFRSTIRLLKQAAVSASPAGGAVKKTTGLAGLPVHPEPRSALLAIYNDTLAALKDIPETAVYRQSVESVTKHRMQVVQSTQSIPQIESQLNAGQIEEVLLQAQDELSLLELMKEKRPWEPLEVQPPANQWKYFQ